MTIAQPHPPRIRRFTRQEYYRMADQGYFINQRVERLDGEIIEMSPQHEPHARAIMQLNEFFTRQLKPPHKLRCQMPLAIGNSDPEPDIAIVPLPMPSEGAPTSAALIVEVADSSLLLDRKKANLYASANVPEYWIVNLLDKTLELHLDPAPDLNSSTGAKYRTISSLEKSRSIQPQSIPTSPLQIATLFEPS
jgi:Uma2 family endonuclease